MPAILAPPANGENCTSSWPFTFTRTLEGTLTVFPTVSTENLGYIIGKLGSTIKLSRLCVYGGIFEFFWAWRFYDSNDRIGQTDIAKFELIVTMFASAFVPHFASTQGSSTKEREPQTAQRSKHSYLRTTSSIFAQKKWMNVWCVLGVNSKKVCVMEVEDCLHLNIKSDEMMMIIIILIVVEEATTMFFVFFITSLTLKFIKHCFISF